MLAGWNVREEEASVRTGDRVSVEIGDADVSSSERAPARLVDHAAGDRGSSPLGEQWRGRKQRDY